MRWKPTPSPQSDGHRGVEVSARYGTERVDTCHDGQAERERDTCESDTKLRISRGQNRTAASAQDEPEGTEKFGRKFREHGVPPLDW